MNPVDKILADKYLKEYEGNKKQAMKAVWSDFTNVPIEHRQYKKAESIIASIRGRR